MTVEEKQQQFNAAMALYSSRKVYPLFGTVVAVINCTLQLYLLWRVLPLSIGPVQQLALFLAACLLTDFINGLVHIYMDNNDSYASLAGPLIANFHLHHKTPLYRKHWLPVVYFVESGSKVWLVGFLAVTAWVVTVTPLPPPLAWLLVYVGILSSWAEVSHYLCHSSTAPLVQLLAGCGLLLSKRHHARHHLEDNRNYAFLNGWSDPLLNLIAHRYYPGYRHTTDQHFARYDTGSSDSR